MTSTSVQNLIDTCLPQMRKSQTKTLAWAVLGCLMRPLGLLTEMARGMRGGTTLRHKLKRLHRFLSNPRIFIEEQAESLLNWLLARRGMLQTPLVAMDWTVEHDMYVLSLSLIWDRRAVPFYWYVIEKGKLKHSQNQIESTAVELLKSWMRGRPCILLADRGFHRTALIRALAEKYQMGFVIRVIKTTHVKVKGHKGSLENLRLKTGKVRDFKQAQYGAMARVPIRLVVKRVRIKKKLHTWYLVTSLQQEDKHRIVNHYERRMGIEASFRDLKTGLGWRRQPHIRDPERLSRYLLILAVAMIVALVTAERKRGQLAKHRVALQVAWGQRKSVSLVQLGIWLVQQLDDRETSLHSRKTAWLWG